MQREADSCLLSSAGTLNHLGQNTHVGLAGTDSPTANTTSTEKATTNKKKPSCSHYSDSRPGHEHQSNGTDYLLFAFSYFTGAGALEVPS